ncbi:hypothetical protein EPYR_03750 [Erwinia pyrifoliae DSM 12163]|nr:hypothetical protein EPYR_03750 [Erwinia pyrifoliae DSM 12163]
MTNNVTMGWIRLYADKRALQPDNFDIQQDERHEAADFLFNHTGHYRHLSDPSVYQTAA